MWDIHTLSVEDWSCDLNIAMVKAKMLRRDLSAEFFCLGCCFGLKMPGAKDVASLEEGLLSIHEILGVSPSTWEVGPEPSKVQGYSSLHKQKV